MNFQAESKRSGDEFEELVQQDLKERGFVAIEKNVYISGTGCEVDFIAYGSTRQEDPQFAGSWQGIEYVESKGGKKDNGKRPGAQRTDNVKKAIANAALVKTKYPDIYFVVYFSAEPIRFSWSAEMINTALANNILDEVRYITSYKADTEQLSLPIEPKDINPETLGDAIHIVYPDGLKVPEHMMDPNVGVYRGPSPNIRNRSHQ